VISGDYGGVWLVHIQFHVSARHGSFGALDDDWDTGCRVGSEFGPIQMIVHFPAQMMPEIACAISFR
jgi:hypothetical protein